MGRLLGVLIRAIHQVQSLNSADTAVALELAIASFWQPTIAGQRLHMRYLPTYKIAGLGQLCKGHVTGRGGIDMGCKAPFEGHSGRHG